MITNRVEVPQPWHTTKILDSLDHSWPQIFAAGGFRFRLNPNQLLQACGCPAAVDLRGSFYGLRVASREAPNQMGDFFCKVPKNLGESTRERSGVNHVSHRLTATKTTDIP